MVAENLLSYVHMLSSRIDRAFLGEVEARHGITLAEWRVMLTLVRTPGTTAARIIERWGMEKMAASRAIARLERMGHLRRDRDPADRRSQVLSLTAKGKRLYRQIIPGATARNQEILACLDEGETEMLRATLVKLVDRTARLG